MMELREAIEVRAEGWRERLALGGWCWLDWLQCIRQSDEGRMTWDWRPTMADPKHPRHHDEAFKRKIVDWQRCVGQVLRGRVPVR